MEIKQVEFLCSNTQVSKLPPIDKPEYAFIGRSNVGKSSLVNMICNHSGIAKTSSKPGKTQLINHFLVNQTWYLVDLPGYGFAKVSKTNREAWQTMIRFYLQKRENLQCVFALIDSRLEPQKIDLEFCTKLGEWRVPFVLCFTKADKQSRPKTDQNIALFRKALLERFDEIPQIFTSSAETKLGREEILKFINHINSNFEPMNL